MATKAVKRDRRGAVIMLTLGVMVTGLTGSFAANGGSDSVLVEQATVSTTGGASFGGGTSANSGISQSGSAGDIVERPNLP